MTRQAIEDRIRMNLGESGKAVDVRLQPDPFKGWRVSVISDAFNGLSTSARRKISLNGLEREYFEAAEFLTEIEREWAGALIQNSDLSDLPLWSDALTRTINIIENPITFASDLDVDIERPIKVTFYSVRGGVGRSTALTYAARILADKGFRVVCVDLDLEAPGLASLFGVEDQVQDDMGVVHLLTALDRGESPDASKHLIRVKETDELYCLPAGKPTAEYARLLQFVSPSAWYSEERNPLKELVSLVSDKLPFKPDVILFDSRTGISEISAPLLFDISDLAVLVFFPHPQAKQAMFEITRALIASKSDRSRVSQDITPEPRFLASPVPAGRSAEGAQRYRTRAAEWVDEWLAKTPLTLESREAIVDSMHTIGYRENTAMSDSSIANPEIWADYAPVADWIERLLPTRDQYIQVDLKSDKDQILGELNFESGLAEQQANFLDTFVEVASTKRALDPRVPIVLGRKGVGKTAIFRRLLEETDMRAIPITAPSPLSKGHPWILNSESFQIAEEILNESSTGWSSFWKLLIVLACNYSEDDLPKTQHVGSVALPQSLPGNSATLAFIEEILKLPRAALLVSEAFDNLETSQASPFLLLFDGLDTGFGSAIKDRNRRQSALQGLCELVLNRLSDEKIRFKVVLREDIWRVLQFENKSHFYGHSVTLEWKDQASYYKVVLKQALRSQAFIKLVEDAAPSVNLSAVNEWAEREVTSVWNVLVGERMKGGNTAKTANWVWSRLADANEDHSPRYLLQLFREVLSFERKEQKKSSFERSILRPRGLSVSLPTVSQQALDALSNEEFPELNPLLSKLRDIGKTPFSGEELKENPDDLALAREVGLVGVYEGTEEKVERYRVPEIYRYALKMSRRGQA
jgi:MinD-like ATPase involved in chromosome partitioning or flagellar assembly